MKTAWLDVLGECLALGKPFGTERLSIAHGEARERVLAEDIRADRDYPHGDLGMMDGYAIGPGSGETFRVEGENVPGAGPGAPLAEGTARRIFTGAELPAGATRVVPQENVRREGDAIAVTAWPDTPFVRPRGREAKRGDVVLARGTRLGPVELGVLATVGCVEAELVRLPRIGHLTTGDEVVPHDQPLPPGKIRNSNLPLIDAMLRQAGLLVGPRAISTDDRAAVLHTVDGLAQTCDVILISGGASVGEHDHARVALEAAGFAFLAHGLHVRPGRPAGIARRGDQWAFALPGNPLSHLVVLRLLVIPILRTCAGESDVEPKLLRGVLAGEVERDVPRRDTFWPARLAVRDGVIHARPGRFLSSGDLIGTAGINGFVNLPINQPPPAPGEPINVLPLLPTFP